jgi:hypothetical protein
LVHLCRHLQLDTEVEQVHDTVDTASYFGYERRVIGLGHKRPGRVCPKNQTCMEKSCTY